MRQQTWSGEIMFTQSDGTGMSLLSQLMVLKKSILDQKAYQKPQYYATPI